jgi:hypothetical protein
MINAANRANALMSQSPVELGSMSAPARKRPAYCTAAKWREGPQAEVKAQRFLQINSLL